MYEINLQDIKDYVSTVPQDQPVGTPQHINGCLIGKALQMKYGDNRILVGTHNTYFHVNGQDISTPADVEEAAEKFDGLWPRWEINYDYEDDEETYPPVTRAVLQERMPELFG